MSSEQQAPEETVPEVPTESRVAETPKPSVASAVEEKKIPAKHRNPAWWKNTYFWLGAILFAVFLIGLIRGPLAIRDPGQKREDDLVVWLYLVAAIVMVVNGMISHRQTMRELEEETHG